MTRWKEGQVEERARLGGGPGRRARRRGGPGGREGKKGLGRRDRWEQVWVGEHEHMKRMVT